MLVGLVAPVFGTLSENALGAAPLRISPGCAKDVANCTDDEREWLQVTSICHRNPELCTYSSRLSAYQPNYAIYQYTAHDENAMEVHYSFRYLFSKPNCMPQRIRHDNVSLETANQFRFKENLPDLLCLMRWGSRSEYFFTYTGRFDFYLFSRESGPVINRISNPAIHYRKNFAHLGGEHVKMEWFNASLEHRSNGQVISADSTVSDSSSADFGRLQTQVEYQNGNYRYFDALSRNSNFVALDH